MEQLDEADEIYGLRHSHLRGVDSSLARMVKHTGDALNVKSETDLVEIRLP